MNLIFYSFGLLLISFTLIPLIHSDYWTFRIFEYPRNQKFFLTLLCLLGWGIWGQFASPWAYVFTALLVANAAYLCYKLFPYTPLAPKQLLYGGARPDRLIRLLIYNVYQYNRKSEPFLQLVSRLDPDLILMAETDQWWADQTAVFQEKYPHSVLKPLENTYGMLLYSKMELRGATVKFLVEEDVPSIHTEVMLPSGTAVSLYCVHPTPPVPQENPRSTERDKELLLVAREIRETKQKVPVIVAGDLNDVAWSYTTELFQKVSGLLDPRLGRGFYSTFHAKIPFLRFPLDHIFCSGDFKLVRLQRLPAIGSDHFPMFVELAYDPEAVQQQQKPEASSEDLELADEKINADTDADREAGTAGSRGHQAS